MCFQNILSRKHGTLHTCFCEKLMFTLLRLHKKKWMLSYCSFFEDLVFDTLFCLFRVRQNNIHEIVSEKSFPIVIYFYLKVDVGKYVT